MQILSRTKSKLTWYNLTFLHISAIFNILKNKEN